MKKTVLIYILVLTGFSVGAQNNFVSAGQTITTASGSVAYSVGQAIYTSNSDAIAGSIEMGINQPYTITTFLGTDVPEVSMTLAMYPNPTTDYVALQIGNNVPANLQYSLYDLQGKKLLSAPITSENTAISLQEYAAGIYFVAITNDSKALQVFKIIKK